MLDAIFSGIGFLGLIAGAICFILVIMARMSMEQKAKDEGRFLKLGFILMVAGILFMFIPNMYVVVDAGTAGVPKTFGVVEDRIMEPGLHLKSPFTEVIPMSTRTQKYLDYGTADKATIVALSNDGLQTTMGIAINFHLNPSKITELYKVVGTDYQGTVMVNPIHSVPRDLISSHDTKTLYSASQEGTTDRAKLEAELFTGITDRLNAIGVRDSIIIEQVSIRDIDFPQVYKDSIASKMKMDTEIQQKALEVTKQEMEAKRVSAEAEGIASKARIEAQGKADALRIEAQGIKDAADKIGLVSPQYLNVLYLQTMKDNPKAIYIPIDENGLPIFKNVDATA